MNTSTKILAALSLLLCVAAFMAAILQPTYLGDYYFLGILIFVEVMLIALWEYARRLFPVLLVVFLWAGTDIPLNDLWTSRRWVVLGIAAITGLAIYLRSRGHHFQLVHLLALCCVISAWISAMISSFPQVAQLKALSLFLLFAYAATGARLAIVGREAKFCSGLLLGCELLAYAGAFSYFILKHEVFGNPNSLGAIIGVAVMPVLLWGIFVSERPSLRRRRMFALILALLLLFASYSRAGIVAAIVSCSVLCLALRQYKLLIKGASVALAAALLIATVAPLRSEQSGSLIAQFVYKGEPQDGVLASRRSIWDQTIISIRAHPWFGTGFGTSPSSYDVTATQGSSLTSNSNATREHGNSYLAITEWVGLMGVIPFFLLVSVVAAYAARVFLWMRRSRDAFSPAVPLAAVLIAGIVHAGFEDWMFAVGYYLCIFFWSLAFMMVDVMPATSSAFVPSSPAFEYSPPPEGLGLPVPGR